MCGIAGIVDFRNTRGADSIRAMIDAVSYRGPDDEGYACFGGPGAEAAIYSGEATPESPRTAAFTYLPRHVLDAASAPEAFLWLGHRRLAILDVSPGGHQPMGSADARDWIVYNGEIYNYVELRDELARLGHAFRSQSDTEVILAAYRQWGRACLTHLNGMFAFVLFDRAARLLFAARDRFGVKPVYYWISPAGQICFASEIKQFAVLEGWRARRNGQRAYDFMSWGVLDHTDETLFEGVYQLRGGEALHLDLSGGGPCVTAGQRLPVYRWYELKAAPFSGSLADAGAEFKRLLADSIRLRLRSDVAVGSCLSGGLDSSSIVCLMNEALKAQNAHALQQTFSACASVKRFDEREFIDEVVRYTGVASHCVYPSSGELFGTLDRLTRHQDEPFGSTSIYAQWHVFRLAAQHGVKVMLDGQGADELLAGYHNYFGARLGGLLRALRLIDWWRESHAIERVHGYPLHWSVQQTLNYVLPEALRQPLRRLAGKSFASPEWLDLDALRAEPRDPLAETGAGGSGSVQAMSRAQLVSASLPMLLHSEDRSSMAHSIEARVPFLDYRLVEFALGLPDAYKISGGITKRVLREGMLGVLPEKVRCRTDKLGFVTPEEVWLRVEQPDAFRQALREAVEASAGALRANTLNRLENMIAGRAAFDFAIWRQISLGRWIKIFGVEA